MKNLENNIEYMYEKKMRQQKQPEKQTELVDQIQRTKKISKQEGILKKGAQKRDF